MGGGGDGHQVVGHGVVVVVGGGEGAPAAGEGAEVDGVAGELGRGGERDDDLEAVLALVGADDAGSPRMEVARARPPGCRPGSSPPAGRSARAVWDPPLAWPGGWRPRPPS